MAGVVWGASPTEFARLVRQSKTQTEILRHFGLANKGGNWASVLRRVKAEGLDVSHLRSWAHSLQLLNFSKAVPLEQVLIKGSTFCRTHLKRRLLKERLLEKVCAICGLGDRWKGKPLVLTLDHANGDPTDHRLANLRLLCPNCSSQLPTHAGRNSRKSPVWTCSLCGGAVSKGSTRCVACAHKASRRVQRPDRDFLVKAVERDGFEAVGRRFGVSGNAVRKWLR